MQNGPLNLLTSATVKKLEFHKSKMADGRKNFEFLKIQDGVGRHLENTKSRYLRNGLTDLHEI